MVLLARVVARKAWVPGGAGRHDEDDGTRKTKGSHVPVKRGGSRINLLHEKIISSQCKHIVGFKTRT